MAKEQELAPGAMAPLLQELRGQSLEAIGLLEYTNEDGDREYKSLIFTIKDGKIVYVKELDVAATTSDAINVATGWIDQTYWRD